jgi:hypothetical protein
MVNATIDLAPLPGTVLESPLELNLLVAVGRRSPATDDRTGHQPETVTWLNREGLGVVLGVVH